MSARLLASPWMSSAEVARQFGVDSRTVRMWGARGKLTRTRSRPGGNWRYAEGEVAALLERHTDRPLQGGDR